MTDASWRDQLAGERLQLDREFAERVREAGFSSQEWDLVMTAVEFDVERPDDPEAARLVADTSRLPAVLPELDGLSDRTAALPGGAGAGEPGGSSGGASGGLLDAVKGLLGIGSGGVDPDRERAAERLAEEYASALQERLESRGRWEAVRSHAAVERTDESSDDR